MLLFRFVEFEPKLDPEDTRCGLDGVDVDDGRLGNGAPPAISS